MGELSVITNDMEAAMKIMADLKRYNNVKMILGKKIGEIVLTPNFRT